MNIFCLERKRQLKKSVSCVQIITRTIYAGARELVPRTCNPINHMQIVVIWYINAPNLINHDVVLYSCKKTCENAYYTILASSHALESIITTVEEEKTHTTPLLIDRTIVLWLPGYSGYNVLYTQYIYSWQHPRRS
jgi:hypothetical protein